MCFNNSNCLQALHSGISFGTSEYCSVGGEGLNWSSLVIYFKNFMTWVTLVLYYNSTCDVFVNALLQDEINRQIFSQLELLSDQY